MRTDKFLAIIIIMFLTELTSAAYVDPGYQFTFNYSRHNMFGGPLKISNNYIGFFGEQDTIKLFDWNTRSLTKTINTLDHAIGLAISDDFIVWSEKESNRPNYDIQIYNMADGNQYSLGNGVSYSISDNRVFYVDYSGNIHGYDMINNQSIAGISNAGSVRGIAVSGNLLTWSAGQSTIYGKYLSGGPQFQISDPVTDNNITPAVTDNFVSWTTGGAGPLGAKNVSSGWQTNIGSKAINHSSHNNFVVWDDWRSGLAQEDIYGYDFIRQEEFPICLDSDRKLNPVIYGNKVAWLSLDENNNYTIEGNLIIPEPCTLSLLALGFVYLRKRIPRFRGQQSQ